MSLTMKETKNLLKRCSRQNNEQKVLVRFQGNFSNPIHQLQFMQVENKSSLIFDFVYRLLFEEISSVLYIDAYIHSLSELPHSTPNDLEGTVSVSVVVRREHRMYK
jgi:hypothetical protein